MLTVHHLGVSTVGTSSREELGLDMNSSGNDPQTRLAPAAYSALHPMRARRR